jgi:hypothetical protein
MTLSWPTHSLWQTEELSKDPTLQSVFRSNVDSFATTNPSSCSLVQEHSNGRRNRRRRRHPVHLSMGVNRTAP